MPAIRKDPSSSLLLLVTGTSVTCAPDATSPLDGDPPWPLGPLSSAYTSASVCCAYDSCMACIAIASTAGFAESTISRVSSNRPEIAPGVTVTVPRLSVPADGFVPSTCAPVASDDDTYLGMLNGVASDRVPRETESTSGRPCMSCVTYRSGRYPGGTTPDAVA